MARDFHEVRVLDLGGELKWKVSTGPRTRRVDVRRDRHGRGSRGVLVPAILPRYRTRRQSFDDLVIQEVQALVAVCADFANIQFGVEDVPPSDPAPWERDSVVLGRGFGADPAHGLPAQVVVYRRPLEQRTRSVMELREMIHAVVLEESSQLIGKHPEDIDPNW
ncbi:MAG: metallopeptidase family protein [Mobiluncus sp.]|uniref:metallopeptidase family protein n=1 Tax=Mobiluncus sp. TaxID=47293 RepID=UPI002585DB3A|nr:metallopeptidase family protein [Mobiluncus sp.]MCI6583774.1 metallopeptidase family protein [Mobiluncus sp.]